MILYFLIEFIGVTLVHNTIQFSSVQLNKTSAHCIVHPLPQAKQSLFLSPFIPPLPTSFPSGYHHTVVCVYVKIYIYIYSFCLIPLASFIQPPNTLPLWQLSFCSMYLCLCSYFFHKFILFIRFHIEVRSYEIKSWWALFSLWLAYFTLHSNLQVHPCYCKK